MQFLPNTMPHELLSDVKKLDIKNLFFHALFFRFRLVKFERNRFHFESFFAHSSFDPFLTRTVSRCVCCACKAHRLCQFGSTACQANGANFDSPLGKSDKICEIFMHHWLMLATTRECERVGQPPEIIKIFRFFIIVPSDILKCALARSLARSQLIPPFNTSECLRDTQQCPSH